MRTSSGARASASGTHTRRFSFRRACEWNLIRRGAQGGQGAGREGAAGLSAGSGPALRPPRTDDGPVWDVVLAQHGGQLGVRQGCVVVHGGQRAAEAWGRPGPCNTGRETTASERGGGNRSASGAATRASLPRHSRGLSGQRALRGAGAGPRRELPAQIGGALGTGGEGRGSRAQRRHTLAHLGLDPSEGRGLGATGTSLDPPRLGSGAGPASRDVTLSAIRVRRVEGRGLWPCNQQELPRMWEPGGAARWAGLALPESRGLRSDPTAPLLRRLGVPGRAPARRIAGSCEKGPDPKGQALGEHGSRLGAVARLGRARHTKEACSHLTLNRPPDSQTPCPSTPSHSAGPWPAPAGSHHLPPSPLHLRGNGALGQEAISAPGASSLGRGPGMPMGTGTGRPVMRCMQRWRVPASPTGSPPEARGASPPWLGWPLNPA